MPDFSAFACEAFRMGLREAQDVLAGCDDVEFTYLKATKSLTVKENLWSRLVYHDITGKLAAQVNPGLKNVQFTKDCDLFLLVCPWWRDVWYVNAVRGWQDHCKTSICWIDELWAKNIPDIKHWLPALRQFDHLIVGTEGTGKALANAIGRPCHEVYGGVDTLRFTPYPRQPDRVIDIYSIGRRLEPVHQALMQLADDNGVFYVYDTLQSSVSHSPDYRAHRDMYANVAKRARFFTVSPNRINRPEKTGEQDSVAFRYYEGSAAGAVLIGQAPNCQSFNSMFDWPNAVIEVRADGSDTAEVVSSLIAQPQRIREISRQNARESLLRHDWVYRWEQVLNIAGLAPTQKLLNRKIALKTIAERIGNAD